MALEAVELVVTALTAGAAAGIKDTASGAVKDAYAALLKVLRKRLGRDGRRDQASVVDEHAADPVGRREDLMAALVTAGVGEDEDVVAAAEELLAWVDPAGTQAGKYTVEVRDSQGVQVGDGNTMNLRF